MPTTDQKLAVVIPVTKRATHSVAYTYERAGGGSRAGKFTPNRAVLWRPLNIVRRTAQVSTAGPIGLVPANRPQEVTIELTEPEIE